MRWIGLGLVAVSFALGGRYCSDRLKEKVRRLREWIGLLGRLMTLLNYTLEEPASLVEKAAGELWEKESRVCAALCRSGTPFPFAWKESMKGEAERFSREERELLFSVGDILGSCDLEGQLFRLKAVEAAMEEKLAKAKENDEQNGKLCRDLGLMAGLAVLILLW